MHDARIDQVRRPAVRLASGVCLPLLVLVLGACGSSHRSSQRVAGRQPIQVTAEPVSSAGTDRFTLPAGTDLQGLERRYGNLIPAGGTPPTYKGDHVGLYASLRGKSSCDAGTIAQSLAGNPTEAAAWASTLGVPRAQIVSYMRTLTPVVLRVDTRVTNHGWRSGSVTSFQAVLQAGTSVLVNQYGLPVTKCYCGNPLTTPKLSSNASYSGQSWNGFSSRRFAAVQRAPKAIRVFTLYDPSSGQTWRRTAGSQISAATVSAAGASSGSSSSTASSSEQTVQTASGSESSGATGGSGSGSAVTTQTP